MRSTTEKQWRDPKWWNENAGSASYYCPVNAQFYDSKLHPCCIPRPTQWQGPQDGLPPVGTECEYYKNDEWRKGVIFGHRKHRNGAVDVFIDFGSEWDYTSDLPRFRPIQSDRDNLIQKAKEVYSDGDIRLTDGLGRLADAGMLVDPERKPMSREEAKSVLVGLKGTICKDVPLMSEDNANTILDALGYKD